MALLLRVSLHFYLFVCLFFILCSVRFTFPPFARQKRVLQKRVLSTQKHECNLVTCWTKLKTKQKVDGLFFTDLNNDRWNSHSHSMFKSGIYTVVNRKHFKKLGFCNHKAWAALASLQYQLQYLALAPVSLFFSPRLFIFCSTHLLFSPIMFQNIKPKRAAATVFLSQYGSCPTLPPSPCPSTLHPAFEVCTSESVWRNRNTVSFRRAPSTAWQTAGAHMAPLGCGYKPFVLRKKENQNKSA